MTVWVGYPTSHAGSGACFTEEPRAGCLVCGRDFIAVMRGGRLRRHKTPDPLSREQVRIYGEWCPRRRMADRMAD